MACVSLETCMGWKYDLWYSVNMISLVLQH